MMDKYTAQAKTTQEAIEKGLNVLNISKEQAIIDVITEEKKGFLGIGQRDAVVSVMRKESQYKDELLTEVVSFDRTPRFQSHTHPSKQQNVPQVERTQDDMLPTSDVIEEDSITKTITSEETLEKLSEILQDDDELDQAAIQHVYDYVKNIINAMGIQDVDIQLNQHKERIYMNINATDVGLIIGRHGKVLNSLQRLAQVQLYQHTRQRLFIKLDAENYRQRRRQIVEHVAEKTAQKVIETKQSVVLEPMPAHERKLIHRYLSRYSEVQTRSKGKEPHRYLVVELVN